MQAVALAGCWPAADNASGCPPELQAGANMLTSDVMAGPLEWYGDGSGARCDGKGFVCCPHALLSCCLGHAVCLIIFRSAAISGLHIRGILLLAALQPSSHVSVAGHSDLKVLIERLPSKLPLSTGISGAACASKGSHLPRNRHCMQLQFLQGACIPVHVYWRLRTSCQPGGNTR